MNKAILLITIPGIPGQQQIPYDHVHDAEQAVKQALSSVCEGKGLLRVQMPNNGPVGLDTIVYITIAPGTIFLILSKADFDRQMIQANLSLHPNKRGM